MAHLPAHERRVLVVGGGLAGMSTASVLAQRGYEVHLCGFSAAELIRFFHFYMLGNPEGLAFDVRNRGVHESILGLLRKHLQGEVDGYRDALLDELLLAFPELADAKVLHVEAMTQSNRTRFAPGDAARRPGVRTEHPGLMLAGDNVALPFPAFLMEAAVASGKLAANAVCAQHGVQEAEMPTVALAGTLRAVVRL